MKIDVLENTATSAAIDISGVTPAFLNAIRRTLMSDVPKLAIEDVTIYDNTSALFDEMVAHRLGLFPVPTDLNTFVRRQDCTCNGEGCPNCTVLFTLSKEGPCTVYSGDLVPAADAKFRIVDPKIPLVKLLEGQRVMLEVGAILGDGTQHAKWQAVVAAGYSEYPIIKINGTLKPEVAEKLSKTLPTGVVSIEGGALKVHKPLEAVSWLKSVRKVHGIEGIEIDTVPDRYVFRVETDGALQPIVAIRKAMSIVMDKLKAVEGDVPKLKTAEIEA